MRSRGAFAATWLLATLLATLVGFTATNIVGDVVRGTGPVGEAFDQAAPRARPEPAPTPATRTFSALGGQVTATCVGRPVTLDDAIAAPGWTITEREEGPDEDVDVTFRRGMATTTIEIYCNQGDPRAVIDDEGPAPTTSEQ